MGLSVGGWWVGNWVVESAVRGDGRRFWGCGVVDLVMAALELGSGSGHEASIREAAAGSLLHGVSARAI